MTKMVSSLLVLARSEYKDEQKNLVEIDGLEVIDDSIEELFPVATAKRITLTCHCDEELLVFAERDGLGEVFRNLLDNAIKYSPEGTTITVSAIINPTDITFAFEDEGSGIPQKSQERVLERFFRLEQEGYNNKEGSAGLGLAICRHIVKSFHGDIWVQSPAKPETVSTIFFVSIPRYFFTF